MGKSYLFFICKKGGELYKNIENAPSKNVIADGACFIEGTGILTENDRKCIEDIKIGDKVYSKNVETGEVGYKEVKNTFVKEVDTLVKLKIEDNKIITTVNHAFWVVDKGWVEAGNLNARDIRELRRVYSDIPNSKLQELIYMNKKLYLEMRK